MAVEFTKDIFSEVKSHIEDNDYGRAADVLKHLHPYDIAEVIEDLEDMAIPMLFEFFDAELSAEILAEMDNDDAMKVIKNMKPDLAYKKFFVQMDSDDAADIINQLSVDDRKTFTDYLKVNLGEEALNIISLLKYDEDVAGGLMAKELVRVNVNWDVKACINEIRRQADDVETIYAVYVVDDAGKLMGLVPLSKLIVSKSTAKISEFYHDDLTSVEDTTPGDKVAEIMQKYDLVALPVVDFRGRLIGRITIDDVLDFIKEEADEDYQLASGLSENV